MNIFSIVYIIWGGSEILLNRLIRSGTTDKKKQDKGSLTLIWLMIVLSISIGVFLSIYIQAPISHHPLIRFIGLILIIAGIALRFFSIRSLGKFFTVDVTIRENHKIKKDGIYKTIRHPSYSGSLLSFIGFGITLNNWLSLIIIVFLITGVFLYRIKIEERALIDYFGTDYLEYKKNTYRLIPWVY